MGDFGGGDGAGAMPMRRVCFLGTALHPDQDLGFLADPGIEVWAANEAYRALPAGVKPARIFQLHPRDWREAERTYLYGDGRLPDHLDPDCFGRDVQHLAYLATCGVPVYCQQMMWQAIPTCVVYPFESVRQVVGIPLPPDGVRRLWATSSWGYMAALLVTEHLEAALGLAEVTDFGARGRVQEVLLCGIELALGTSRERTWEWPNFAYYLGLLRGLGAMITLPSCGSSLLSGPHYALGGRPKPGDPDHWVFPGRAGIVEDDGDGEVVLRLGRAPSSGERW